ncbi:MAG: hypothetical protein GY711_05220 [bacterium]|nr:hypothetical protein [bacterium]
MNVQAGGNDFRNNRDLLAAHSPGTHGGADGLVDDVVDDILEALQLADTAGAERILWLIPDFTAAPSHDGEFDNLERRSIRAHLSRANRALREAALAQGVVVFDAAFHARRLVTTPPNLFGHPLVGPPAHGDYDRIFADDLHLSAVSNALLANGIIAALDAELGVSFRGYSVFELADLAHISHP